MRQPVLQSRDLHRARLKILLWACSSVGPWTPLHMSGCSAGCAAGMPLWLGSSKSNWLTCSRALWGSARVGHWGNSLLIRKKVLMKTTHFCPLYPSLAGPASAMYRSWAAASHHSASAETCRPRIILTEIFMLWNPHVQTHSALSRRICCWWGWSKMQ